MSHYNEKLLSALASRSSPDALNAHLAGDPMPALGDPTANLIAGLQELGREARRYDCVHGRRKCTCRLCGGSAICQHDHNRYTCRLCGGGSVCQHGRRKGSCRDCGGSEICQHDRRKYECRPCGGSAICACGRQKKYCRLCGDPRIVSVRCWLFHSRRADRKRGRENDLDREHLLRLSEATHCHYPDCRRPLQWGPGPSQATIERLDNSIGHTKANCVVACFNCNLHHKGRGLRVAPPPPVDQADPELEALRELGEELARALA